MPINPASLPFDEALKFFKGKEANIPTSSWLDVMNEEHDHAFMVAGAAKADLLKDMRDAVTKAMEDGKSLDWFQGQFDEIVAKHGWEYKGTPSWRARVILETNISTSYSAGRYAQMTKPSMLEARPYWVWRHGDSVHPRAQHQAWDGMVLPAGDPFWRTHPTPCGYLCKCRVFNLSPEDVAARGLKVLDKPRPPLGPPRRGEAEPGVDKGFAYTPGATAMDRMRPVIEQKAKSYPKPLAEDLKREMRQYLAKPRVATDRVATVKKIEQWLEDPQGDINVAKVSEKVKEALGTDAEFVRLSPGSVDKQVVHHKELTAEDYKAALKGIPKAQVYRHGSHDVILACRDRDAWYRVALKVTKDRSDVYLVSAHRLNERTLEALRALPRV